MSGFTVRHSIRSIWEENKSVKYTKIQVKGMFVRVGFGPDFPQGDVCLHLAMSFYQVRFKELTGLYV